MTVSWRWASLPLLPLVFAGALVLLERLLLHQPLMGEDALQGQIPESVKQALALNNSLATLFITLSTAVIGAVAYYLKFSYTDFGAPGAFSRVVSAGTLLFATVSIFFGHLWVAGMRNQLTNDFFNPRRPELLWPERLQYYTFLIALCWLALLALDREQVRRPPAPKPGG